MRINGNYLYEVAEVQASCLEADDGDDEEDEDEEDDDEDEEDEDEDEEEETVWTSPQRRCP